MGGRQLAFQVKEGFAFKQVKFGDDFSPTNWSLGGSFIYILTYMTEIPSLIWKCFSHPAALNFKIKFARNLLYSVSDKSDMINSLLNRVQRAAVLSIAHWRKFIKSVFYAYQLFNHIDNRKIWVYKSTFFSPSFFPPHSRIISWYKNNGVGKYWNVDFLNKFE